MSKKKQEADKAKPVEALQEPVQLNVQKDSSGKKIEAERFCPICWGRFKGYGTATNSSFMGKRYYKCDKTIPGSEFGPCGFTWSMEWAEIQAARQQYIAQLQAIIIEHRPVDIQSLR